MDEASGLHFTYSVSTVPSAECRTSSHKGKQIPIKPSLKYLETTTSCSRSVADEDSNLQKDFYVDISVEYIWGVLNAIQSKISHAVLFLS